MNNRKHFDADELKFIEQNYRFRTDKDIAKILNRTEKAIARQRDIHNWKKDNGRPSQKTVSENTIKAIAENGPAFSFAGLTKEQRIEIYKQNFDKNPRYPILVQELHKEELDYYKHKYIEFLDGVDTITLQEEDALHHMIMADVYISRTRRKIKDMETEHQEMKKPLVFGLYEMLDGFETKFMKYQQILRVTREGRLKEDKEQKETFATLVQIYRNKATREEMGNQAALLDLYKNKCSEDMKASRYLLGETGV